LKVQKVTVQKCIEKQHTHHIPLYINEIAFGNHNVSGQCTLLLIDYSLTNLKKKLFEDTCKFNVEGTSGEVQIN